MKDPGAKVRSGHIFDGEAGVVEHCLIRIERNAGRTVENNGLSDCMGNSAKLALVLPQLLFRTLAIFYVRTASIPANYFAVLVANGHGAHEEPPIFSEEWSRARWSCDPGRRARRRDCPPLVQYLHQVFGMKCDLPSRT